MALPVKHVDCCLYTFVAGSDNSKDVVASSLTCENVYVQRSEAMIENGKHYTLEFNDTGRALLMSGLGQHGSNRVHVSSLGFKKIAVCNTDGRIAIQDRSTDTPRVYWIDKPDEIAMRQTMTLSITVDLKNVLSVFGLEKGLAESRHGAGQHVRGASVFWELRTIKPGLVLNDQGSDEWVPRNFKNVRAQWVRHYGGAVGVCTQSHFMVSEKAWKKVC